MRASGVSIGAVITVPVTCRIAAKGPCRPRRDAGTVQGWGHVGSDGVSPVGS